jgi:hypothetical protein
MHARSFFVPARRYRGSRRATRSLLATLAVIAAATPHASSADRPNILVCLADDASYPHMGAYGCRWVNTPGFDRVAAEGLLFHRAYTPNAKCSPSRACLLTGRNSWQLEAAANHVPFFPARFKTYAEALAEHGYHVGHTAKGWAPGHAGYVNGQPRLLLGRPFNRRTITPPARGLSANDYAANFQDFLDARPAGQPFCFWYGSLEPHRPYEFGVGRNRAGKQPADVERVPGYWPDTETVRTDLLDYAFELEYFDLHLRRMLDLLEARGELDHTLVVVTADNGLPFPRAKGQAYEASNHVPLAIRWPRGIRQPGRGIEEFVSFIDLAPTFLDVAGVSPETSGLHPVQGRSLRDLFNADPPGPGQPRRDAVLLGKERHDVGRPHDGGYPIRGIVTREFLYLHNFAPDRWPAGNPETGYLNCDGSPTKTAVIQGRVQPELRPYWQAAFGKRRSEELYQLIPDPDCVTNLAAHAAFAPTTATLRARLFEALRAQADPRLLGDGDRFDAFPYADPTTRQFHERFLRGEPVRAGWINDRDYDPAAAAE